MPVNNSPFTLQDRTATINKIENEFGLFSQLGIFSSQGITTRSFVYDVDESGYGLVEDRAWGAPRDQYAGKGQAKQYSFPIPHFPYDGRVTAADVQNRRQVGTDNTFDSVDAAVARELTTMRTSWAQTREWAHRTAIVEGKVYAPNGTVDVDYYAQLGETRKVVDYELDVPETSVPEKGEEVVQHIQENAFEGSVVASYVAICNPSFFSKLVRHQYNEEAYKYWQANNANGALLRDRLPTMKVGNAITGRTFLGADNILYIEYTGAMKGVPMIPVDKAYALPVDVSETLFKTIYAPMDHLDYVNTEGQEMYSLQVPDADGRGMTLQSESNFADFIFKPQVVVELTA